MNTDKTYAEKIASEYAPKETRKRVRILYARHGGYHREMA